MQLPWQVVPPRSECVFQSDVSFQSRSCGAEFNPQHLLQRMLTLLGAALVNRSSSAGAALPSAQLVLIPQVTLAV